MKTQKLIGNYISCKRTSIWNDACPCDEAIKVPMIHIDERNVDDPTKNNYLGENWYAEGTNHRVINGHICRDFTEDTWAVKFETIEEFENFCSKYEKVILSVNKHDQYTLEIYDSYRE